MQTNKKFGTFVRFLEVSQMKFSMSVERKIQKVNNFSSVCVSKKFKKNLTKKNIIICGKVHCGCCDMLKMTMGTGFGLGTTMM